MRKYFLYLLKKNLLPLACLTLVCVIIYVVPISMAYFEYWINDGVVYYYRQPDLYLENISIALGVMSVSIPVYIFSYKMNKRSIDMCYSLPISKTKILVANFLVGLILLYTSYSVAYLFGFIMAVIRFRSMHLIYYLYLYLSSLIPAFILYSVTAFIFTRTNTIIDGIACVAGAMGLLAMAVAMFDEIFDLWMEYEAYFPFSPLMLATNAFGSAIWSGAIENWFRYWNVSIADRIVIIGPVLNGILWTLIAIASTVGLILSEKNSKAENCGQISKSVFCYKTLIPAYAVIMVAIFMAAQEFVFLFVVAFGAYVASVIYKRTFKIGWKYTVVLGASFVGGILLFLVLNAISNAITLLPIEIPLARL